MMDAVEQLGATVGLKSACAALGVNRAAFYRRRTRQAGTPCDETLRPPPPLKLSTQERQAVVDLLHLEPLVDASPHTIHAMLLDEGRYYCSTRTMYRILAEEGELKERRAVRRHPQYAKPELLATGPNQLWSWDITKLKGPVKWTYFYLYVILDVFSRYVVGWMVASRESATLAKTLISETCAKQGIALGQLTLHADRGSSMKSKAVALLLADLSITKTHSRPHVSNDNPFSEAQFKTLKYRPEFPARFGSLQDSRAFCRPFFRWYNTEHRHSGIAFMTPEDVHYGRATQIMQTRSTTLDAAFEAHPERFKGKRPAPKSLPQAVWINPPVDDDEEQQEVASLH
jgi:putative transposase